MASHLQASAVSGPGPSSLGSQVHAAAVNGDRSSLLKLIAGKSTQLAGPGVSASIVPLPSAKGQSSAADSSAFKLQQVWSNWIWDPSPRGQPLPQVPH